MQHPQKKLQRPRTGLKNTLVKENNLDACDEMISILLKDNIVRDSYIKSCINMGESKEEIEIQLNYFKAEIPANF